MRAWVAKRCAAVALMWLIIAAAQRTGDAESVLLLVRREGSALYVVVQPEG